MGCIFISYRRDDCAADANALYQSLAAEFGKESIFKDVDDVELGANWKTAICGIPPNFTLIGSGFGGVDRGSGWLRSHQPSVWLRAGRR